MSETEGKIIYWYLTNTYKNIEKSKIEEIIQQAFNEWAKFIKVQFIKAVQFVRPDETIIILGFHSNSHSCIENFDGEGGILAHGTMPNNKTNILEIHFDSSENWIFDETFWTLFSKNPIFYTVVLHEIGHCLGLPHSKHVQSIMYPNYNRFKYKLSSDDIINLQNIYEKTNYIENNDENIIFFYLKSFHLEILYFLFLVIIYLKFLKN